MLRHHRKSKDQLSPLYYATSWYRSQWPSQSFDTFSPGVPENGWRGVLHEPGGCRTGEQKSGGSGRHSEYWQKDFQQGKLGSLKKASNPLNIKKCRPLSQSQPWEWGVKATSPQNIYDAVSETITVHFLLFSDFFRSQYGSILSLLLSYQLYLFEFC